MSSPSPPAPAAVVYLDHAAATPLDPDVAAAMQAAAAAFANPSSPHAAGRVAKRVLEAAREQILELVGARTSGPQRDRLVFTSGATEANRLAILGGAAAGTSPGWFCSSARDHASVKEAAAALAEAGWQTFKAPLTPAGRLDFESLRQRCWQQPGDAGPGMLAVTTVCGQTGIREDLAGLADLAAAVPELFLHADATQAAGWDDLCFAASPVTTLAVAPHKFGGPRGIGGLVVRSGVTIAATVPGPQELGLRGGTEAVALAAGFARALERVAADRDCQTRQVMALRQRLEAGVVAAAMRAGIEAVVVGGDSARAPHVALVAVANLDREVVAMAADLAGVCLATGTACASGSSEPPEVLEAIGLEGRFRRGGLRLSIGRTTTAAEVEAAVARLSDVFARLGHPQDAAGSMSIP
jgi:cysteine desulfurase